jgi:hypothetical protein
VVPSLRVGAQLDMQVDRLVEGAQGVRLYQGDRLVYVVEGGRLFPATALPLAVLGLVQGERVLVAELEVVLPLFLLAHLLLLVLDELLDLCAPALFLAGQLELLLAGLVDLGRRSLLLLGEEAGHGPQPAPATDHNS